MPTATTPAARRPHRRSPEPSTPCEMVERCLVARAAAGDVRALEQLFARHRSHLLAIAHGITHCRAAAEDVVQDALVKIWRAADRLDPDRRFLGWATVVVRRTALDHLRADDRARTLTRRAPTPAEACPFTAVDERLDATRLLGGVAGRDDDRRLLTWIHVDGESLEGISTRLGVPVGTVKSRSARARTRLADQLATAA